MAKWVEYFIAQRISQGSTADCGEGDAHLVEGAMMARVARFAVAISVAVMILSLAVIFGFKSEIRSRLTALSGDVIVTSAVEFEPIVRSDEVERIVRESATKIVRVSSYVSKGVILRGAEGVEGVILKGVDADTPMEIFERGLIEGEIPAFGGNDKSRNVIVSKELAATMALSVGDKLELLATFESGALRRDLYRVGAIYSAGGGEGEKSTILTDIRNVQRLNGWGEEQISGYEVVLADPEQDIEVAQRINRELLYSDDDELSQMVASSIRELYPSLFDWLAALDMNGVVVISIMVVVAIFNIITALLILVLERLQMIGVLKALGMNNGALRRLFLLRAVKIGAWGVAWGNGVGIALALLQQRFEVVKLDEAGYLLSSVPIELGVGWLLLLNAGVVATIILVVALPTRIVGSIEPHRAIRFQ